jgi:hypothetical protein
MHLLFWRRRSTRVLTLFLLAAAATARLPITTVTVPVWSVQIVDTAGRAVNGACVSQTWQQYSFESEGHTEELKADRSGHVQFPARTATATLWRRVWRPAAQLGRTHASFGAHAWIIAGAPQRQGSALYESGMQLPNTIVLQPDSSQFEWEPGSIAARCSPI